MSYRSPDIGGYRTFVRNPDGTTPSHTDESSKDNWRERPNAPEHKEQALPITDEHSDGRTKHPPNPGMIQGPPPSSDAPDGEAVKDKVRTPGEPGKPHKDPEPLRGPKRRQEVTGAIQGRPFPGANRQRKQRGEAKRYYKRRYRKTRAKVKQRMKRWYRRFKRRSRYKKDMQRRRDYPQKFERKPGGGQVRNKDRAQKWRKDQKKAVVPLPFVYLPSGEAGTFRDISEDGLVTFELGGVLRELPLDLFFEEVFFPDEGDIETVFAYLDETFGYEGVLQDGDEEEEPDLDTLFDQWSEGQGFNIVAFRVKYRPGVRQKKQKGLAKYKSKMRYRKTRAKSKMKSRKRYKKMKKLPAFKRQQKIRRKHPERFKRRVGEVLTAPDISFVVGRGLALGYLHGVSPMTGLVSFIQVSQDNVTQIRSLPVEEFLEATVFLSDQDMEAFYKIVDVTLGEDAYDDPDRDNDEATPADPYLIDPTDDDHIFGQVNLPEEYLTTAQKVAEVYIERFNREDERENWFDRGTDRQEEKRAPHTPGDKLEAPAVEENPGSGKVIPWNSDFMNKKAVLLKEIQRSCGPGVHTRSEGIKIKLKRVDARNSIWLFDAQGSNGPYRVRIKAKPKGNIKDPNKTHILVSCSCPFWRWQGPEHWAQNKGYLYGRPRGTASKPDIKDPTGEHGACKHMLAVLRQISTYREVPRRRGKRASQSLRYLADKLATGEVWIDITPAETMAQRVARRYLEQRGS